MSEATQAIHPIMRIEKIGKGLTRVHYHSGSFRSVDVRGEQRLPNGDVVLKVVCGESAGNQILCREGRDRKYLDFTEGAAAKAVREILSSV